MNWCSTSNYGYYHNVRIASERCNAGLKEFLNTDNLCTAGIREAKVIPLLNCMTLVSGIIAVNQQSNGLKK